MKTSRDVALTCFICSRAYVYDPLKGHTSQFCNSCYATQQRLIRKAEYVAYKGGKCQTCGYDRCLRALHFHHRDPERKKFNISRSMTWAIKKVREELDKCDLLCSNCHAEEHERRDKYRQADARQARLDSICE